MDGDSRAQIARRAHALAAELARAPVDPDRMFVIGDTPHDVRCGKEIGARTVAVATGAYSQVELGAENPWLTLSALPAPERFAELVRGGRPGA
jgi:phosphoglycolate phosphatase-like HAD superfamily hydrolase